MSRAEGWRGSAAGWAGEHGSDAQPGLPTRAAPLPLAPPYALLPRSFLGDCTGRAGLAQLSDTFVSDPHLFFKEGQSVRAAVVTADRERARFAVALKQSVCGSRDAAYLAALFADLDAAEQLGGEADGIDWDGPLRIGGVGELRGGVACGLPARRTSSMRAHDPAPAPCHPAVAGEVDAAKDYGLLCNLAANSDVVALAAPHQVPAGAAQEPGTSVRAVVLDVSHKDGIVDLSLQPALLARAEAVAAAAQSSAAPKRKKARKSAAAGSGEAAPLQEGQQVEVTIELVSMAGCWGWVHGWRWPRPHARRCARVAGTPSPASPHPNSPQVKPLEGYCVASLNSPAGAAEGPQPLLGFFATADFNLQQEQQQQAVQHQFGAGDSLAATVAALPSAATGGRLLLSVPLAAQPLRAKGAKAAAAGAKQQQQQQQHVGPAVGTCVEATVVAVHPLHADLALEGGCHGRLHATEAAGEDSGTQSPLAALSTGDTLSVAVLGRVQTAEGRRHGMLECSSQADVVAAARARQPLPRRATAAWGTLKPGQQLRGYVHDVEAGYVWCAFSPAIRGRAFAAQVRRA